MAGIRIPRQADRHRPPSAANRALPPPPRLADVVRSYGGLRAAPLVRPFHGQAPGRRSGHIKSASVQSISPSPTPIRPREDLLVPIHFPRGTQEERPMVEAP